MNKTIKIIIIMAALGFSGYVLLKKLFPLDFDDLDDIFQDEDSFGV